MSHVDAYLALVAKRLLLRRRARAEVLEEMRSHLAELEGRRGAPFHDAREVAAAFGEPRALARHINASVPWTYARMPISLLLSGPLAMVAMGFAMAPIAYVLAPLTNAHGIIGPALLSCLMATVWMVYYLGPAAALIHGRWLCARPAHCRIAILLPGALMTVAIAVSWLVRLNAGALAYRINELLAVATYGAISAMFCMLATPTDTGAWRFRIALPLVAIASSIASAEIGGLPGLLTRFAPVLGNALAALLLAWLIPMLVRREDGVALAA